MQLSQAPQLPPCAALCGAARRTRRTGRAQPRASLGAAPPDWSSASVLKEWASVCSSIAAGQTTILLRKGGIAEKGSRPRCAYRRSLAG